MLVAGFGYANFVLAGYFKDVEADAATGYDTAPIRFGRPVAAVGSHILAILTLGTLAAHMSVAGASNGIPPTTMLFAAGAVVASLVAQTRLPRVRCDSEAHRAIVPVVHAFVLAQATVAAMYRPDWWPGLALFYAVFVLVMSRRPETGQV
jgi:4-hydroxybenzoate polyprenyltransferase